MYNVFENGTLTIMAKELYQEERKRTRLDGWFIAKETELELCEKYKNGDVSEGDAKALQEGIFPVVLLFRNIVMNFTTKSSFMVTKEDSNI